MIEIHEKMRSCRLCGLHRLRNNVVIGSGWPDSPIVFLGEAPGRDEDLQGEAFVGAAGRVLNRVLELLGLDRTQVWVTNVVHCRPTDDGRSNRAPTDEEMAACRSWFEGDLKRVPRRLIVTLGNTPLRALTNEGGITKRHGRLITGYEIPIFPMFHPAYVLYRRDRADVYRQDIDRLQEVINGMELLPAGESDGDVEEPRRIEQLQLF